jgi:RNA polymerase sigma-70 factor (ECF subfamily)
MTDELASRLATDLEAHFEGLVRAYQDRLFAFALRLTRSREEAEECTQDAFVRAYRALERYSVEQKRELRLRPWLYRITLNVVRNRVRKPSLVAVSVEAPQANGMTSSPEDEPERVILQQEGWNDLEAALGRLPRRYRTAVVLRHVQGLSYAEAAEVLDQPVGTTKSDVHRGLGLLREVLQGASPEDQKRIRTRNG